MEYPSQLLYNYCIIIIMLYYKEDYAIEWFPKSYYFQVIIKKVLKCLQKH